MKAILLSLLLLNICYHITDAQQTNFSKIYYDFPSYSTADDMVLTDDNGVIICGHILSNPSIMKVDSTGNIEWSKQIGATAGSLISIIETNDSSYVAVGNIDNQVNFVNDLFIVKFDRNGNLLKSKAISKLENQGSNSIIQTKDGGFIIVGFEFLYTNPNLSILIVKTDSLFNVEWSKMLRGANFISSVSEIKQMADSNYMICGYVENNPLNFEYGYLCKIDQSGDVLWSKFYRPSISQFFRINDFVASDQSLFVYGFSDTETFIMKTDMDGNINWSESFMSAQVASNCIACKMPELTLLSNGQLLIPTGSSTYNWSALLLDVDTIGTLNWARSLDNSVHEVLETNSGKFFLLSNKYPKVGLSQIDSLGSVNICSSLYQVNSTVNSIVDSIGAMSIISMSLVTSNIVLTDSNIYVPHQDGCLDVFNDILNNEISGIEIFPNPSGSIVTLKLNQSFVNGQLSIHDNLGRKVLCKQIEGNSSNEIYLEHGLKQGVYTVIVQTSERNFRKKMIVN